MLKDRFYEHMVLTNADLPIRIFRVDAWRPAELFSSHWHEQVELHYFVAGSGVVRCGGEHIDVNRGDLVLVNSNELHSGESTLPNTSYYVLIFDVSLLQGSTAGTIDALFVQPISQNQILFENRLGDDAEMHACVRRIIDEYERKRDGYVIAVKSQILWLVVLLLRGHVRRVMSNAEYSARLLTARRYQQALDFIERNYSQSITLEQLARMSSVSPPHFCRQFKALTGKTLSDYVNAKRIDHAAKLLGSAAVNVSEAAAQCGFDDFNYFSRLFRRYKDMSPSQYRKMVNHQVKSDAV